MESKKPCPLNRETEWLEADGLGGFASGTTLGIPTRRYHALLLSAVTPPTGRVALVNGFEAWVEMENGSFPLTSQMYYPGVLSPNGAQGIDSFEDFPWPKWTYRLPYGMTLEQELFVPRGSSLTALSWKIVNPKGFHRLTVRPFFSCRDYHSLQKENKDFKMEAEEAEGPIVRWRPYATLPGIAALTNGRYLPEPKWYNRVLYEKEQERGLDFLEDLAAPGIFQWDLSQGPALLLFAPQVPGQAAPWTGPVEAGKVYGSLREQEEKRRRAFSGNFARSADSYFVKRGKGTTIIAGYPWFTDWGRDTFIAMRGLGIAGGRLPECREILLEWAKVISRGMVPNRFPDSGEEPEYHSVDASLWYIIAVYEYLRALKGDKLTAGDWGDFREPVDRILQGYSEGTRWGIRADEDGLLWAGEGDDSLTWMDARVDHQAVTPRVGKPVEVEALWLNALWIAGHFSPKWKLLYQKGAGQFQRKFWNESGGFLFDVVDVKRQPGAVDFSFRPNQIFAVGGLPLALVEKDKAQKIVEAVEAKLWTPRGLKSLAASEPGYRRRYQGGVTERDNAYHQGTAWVWLMGPFVEAWVRVRGNNAQAKKEAREKFLEPLLEQSNRQGLGHLPEIADPERPFTARGCPFQAWSLGELMRLDMVVLR